LRGFVGRKREPEADDVALQVLCRVFDDGADRKYDHWLKWYDPTQWLHYSRALGAFIWMNMESDNQWRLRVEARLDALEAR
jgi:hypothetical protein